MKLGPRLLLVVAGAGAYVGLAVAGWNGLPHFVRIRHESHWRSCF
jgi:hypothetical protein